MKINKKIVIGILLIIGILVFVRLLGFYYINKEGFENNQEIKTIISYWDNHTGFYSELLSKLNHYLYCKKNKINFKIAYNNWNYTYKEGWVDYFENNDLIFNNDKINDENIKKNAWLL